jgi:hypothetical protein
MPWVTCIQNATGVTSAVNTDLVKQMDDKISVTVVNYIDGTSLVVQGSLDTILAEMEQQESGDLGDLVNGLFKPKGT